jgi:hypothetical protein
MNWLVNASCGRNASLKLFPCIECRPSYDTSLTGNARQDARLARHFVQILGIVGTAEDANDCIDALFSLDEDSEERLQLLNRRVDVYERLIAVYKKSLTSN